MAPTADAGQNRMHAQEPRGLHIALWVAQVLLAIMFGMAGVMKMTTPVPELARTLGWPGDLPPPLVRFIGASELAGALGMLLPSLTRIRPELTPIAGLGLATVMVLAIVFHLSRGEISALGITVFLGGLAAFVAWGRLKKAPIHPRGHQS